MSYGISVPKSLAQYSSTQVLAGFYLLVNVQAQFDGFIRSTEIYADSAGRIYFYVRFRLVNLNIKA